jgi:hypothetical protein
VCALAVDAKGQLYVGINVAETTQRVAVYSPTASGSAAPVRTLTVTDFVQILDIAVDAAGNLYVAGYTGNGNNEIGVYSPQADGLAAPVRRIIFTSSNVYGVAVDATGDVFANVCRNCIDTSLEVEELAPYASGVATPLRTIGLPLGSGNRLSNGGPVRLDGAGNLFTSAELSLGDLDTPATIIYDLGPSASPKAVPDVVVTVTGSYSSLFALN